MADCGCFSALTSGPRKRRADPSGDGEQLPSKDAQDEERRQSLHVVELVRGMQLATAAAASCTADPAGTPLSPTSPVGVVNSRQLAESAARAPGQRSMMSTEAPAVVPPAICPTLVMKSAINYEVSLECLRGLSTGTLDVLGMSGKKALGVCSHWREHGQDDGAVLREARGRPPDQNEVSRV